MSRIYIANLASLAVSVEQARPRRVLTVIDPGTPVPALPSVEPGNHLQLFFHDIVEARHPEAILPGEEHVRRIVEFGAEFKTNVSKHVDMLVIGDADFVQFADGMQTGKMKKASALRADGFDIEIMAERDFLALLG